MSQQNVEIVRRIHALLDRGDDAVWDRVSPDFVGDFLRRLIDPAMLRGRDEVRDFYNREWRATWTDGTRWEAVELIDAADGVLALTRICGRGKTSGVEVEALVWSLWTFRDGGGARVPPVR